MGKPSPTVLVLIIEKFILWEDVMVAWGEPIRSNRSEEFEAAGAGPRAACEPLASSTAGCEALPKSSPLDAAGPGGAWLKALQSPKSPFPLAAVTEKEPVRGKGKELSQVHSTNATVCTLKQTELNCVRPDEHLRVPSPSGHYSFS